MELTYHQEGDYLIPDLVLSDTTHYHLGKYGRMRQRHGYEEPFNVKYWSIGNENFFRSPSQFRQRIEPERTLAAAFRPYFIWHQFCFRLSQYLCDIKRQHDCFPTLASVVA